MKLFQLLFHLFLLVLAKILIEMCEKTSFHWTLLLEINNIKLNYAEPAFFTTNKISQENQQLPAT